MNIDLTDWAWKQPVDGQSRLVLLYGARAGWGHTDDEIAAATGISRHGVRKTVDRLVELGYCLRGTNNVSWLAPTAEQLPAMT